MADWPNPDQPGYPQNPERGSGWRTMETAPKDARTILLRFPARGFSSPQIVAGHFAHGGGEEQPPFGPGWFRPALNPDGSVAYFAEIGAEPDAWMPLPEGPCLTHADHAASVAAAAEAMREAAVRHIAARMAGWNAETDPEDEEINSHFVFAAQLLLSEIRALPIPSADAWAIRARAAGGDAPCMRCDGGDCQQCGGNPA